MFKKGDKVCKVNGETFSNCELVCTVDSVDGHRVWLEETMTHMGSTSLKLAQVPHKHAELIKSWADGAEIEVKYNSDEWRTATAPMWAPRGEYRIKPQLTEEQIEKQSIVEEIEKLQKRLDKLKV